MCTTSHAAAILRAAFTASTTGQVLTPTEAQLAFNTAKEVSQGTKDAEDLKRLSHVMSYAEPYLRIGPSA
jgi:hypothetical protein